MSISPAAHAPFLVMSLVERETCHSQIAIAERVGLDKTTLTYLIDGLEQDGLVKPQPRSRRTGAAAHINLTAKGQKTLARYTKAVEAVEAQVLSRLSTSETTQFQHLLVAAAGLEERQSGTPPTDDEENLHICKVTLGSRRKALTCRAGCRSL